MLAGFFQGWKKPHAPETHLEILRQSSHVVLAVDSSASRVVGFVTVLSDGRQAAFIPLLEVLSNYQHRGIGTELMKRVLAKFSSIPAIDLTCDPHLQGFYARFGMQPSVGMIMRNY